MLIILSRRTAICQLVAELYLTGVTPLGAVSHKFFFFNLILINKHEARSQLVGPTELVNELHFI